MSARRLGLVCALVVVYAFCYAAIKSGLAYAPPLLFAGMRALIAGAVLLAVSVAGSRVLVPDRRLWPGVLALALLGTTLGYGAMFLAPGRSGAGISSVLGNTGSLLLGLLGWIFLGEPLGRAKVEGLAMGAAGVTLIAYPSVSDPSLSGPAAALFPLTAALALAGSAVILKRMDVGKHIGPVLAWQLLLGAAPLLAASRWIEADKSVEWNVPFILLLLFLAILGTAAATWVWYWLVQREDVGRLGVFLFVVPLLGLVLAWALFDETASPRTVGGSILAIAAVLRVAVSRRDAPVPLPTGSP